MKGSKNNKMEIGMPYNIKHELHIAVDQISQVMEMLPETCRNYIDQSAIANPNKPSSNKEVGTDLDKNYKEVDFKNPKKPNYSEIADSSLSLNQVGNQSILFDISDLLGNKNRTSQVNSIGELILENDSDYYLSINVDLDMVDLAFSGDKLSYYQNSVEACRKI